LQGTRHSKAADSAGIPATGNTMPPGRGTALVTLQRSAVMRNTTWGLAVYRRRIHPAYFLVCEKAALCADTTITLRSAATPY
jgi:hypothetical protein